MAYVMGTVSAANIQSQTATINWTAASGGTGPYSYNVYRSTTTGFATGAGNLIATLGVGVLTFNDTGLIPNTVYYYVVDSLDTGNANAVAASAQFTMASTLPQQLSQNQAVPTQIAGTVDSQFSSESFDCVIDASVVGTLYPGQAVMLKDTTTPYRTVVPAVNANDNVWGFIQYDFIHQSFVAGTPCTVSTGGNVIRLFATQTIAKGTQVCYDPTAIAAVQNTQANGGSGAATIVGYALQQGANNGVPFAVYQKTPTFATA